MLYRCATGLLKIHLTADSPGSVSTRGNTIQCSSPSPVLFWNRCHCASPQRPRHSYKLKICLSYCICAMKAPPLDMGIVSAVVPMLKSYPFWINLGWRWRPWNRSMSCLEQEATPLACVWNQIPPLFWHVCPVCCEASPTCFAAACLRYPFGHLLKLGNLHFYSKA